MIRNYMVTAAAATFHSGVLRLTDEQARARVHAIESTKKDGEYRILSPVQFKRGEQVGFDGAVNKSMLECLDPADSETDPTATRIKKGRKSPTESEPPAGDE